MGCPSGPHHLRIDCLVYGPYGMGRLDGRVIFVPYTAPGDEGEVLRTEEKKDYALGTLLSLSRSSPARRPPPCPYFPRCGGCPWQHIAYDQQLKAKENLLREHLRRIAGLSDPPLLPILPSPREWGYRHRLRLRVDQSKSLGFYQARSHEVVEIASCLLAEDVLNEHLPLAREWLLRLRTPVRRLELISQGDTPRVVLVGNAEGKFQAEDREESARFLQEHPSVGGLVLFGRRWRQVWGDSRIFLDLGVEGLYIRVRHGGFTQVNPLGNQALIATLLRLGGFGAEERILELYCGAGNLSLPIARRVRELVGVEQNPLSVADAKENAREQGVGNCLFLCALAHREVEEFLKRGERFDGVVLDPPRAGAAEVVGSFSQLGAPKVLYVSCHPATLARDLRELLRQGYRVQAVQPLDLFPHTYHLETVVSLLLT